MSALAKTLALLDLWFQLDPPGWVGAVDHPVNQVPEGRLTRPATPRRLDFEPHPLDGFRIDDGTPVWFRYPDDADSLAEWIDARHHNRVWLSVQTTSRQDWNVRFKRWVPSARPGKDHAFFVPGPRSKHQRGHAVDVGRLSLYRPTGMVPTPPRWLWPGRVPMRMVTLFDGDPGQGKSTVTLDIAARVTRGRGFPDGTSGDARGAVVLLSAEDDPHHTMEPRLMAAGADLDLVHIVTGMRDIDGQPSVPGDIDLLQALVRRTDASLVVIDPFIAYLDEGIDSYRDNQVRRAMSALKSLAEAEDVAVVLVRHLKKDNAGGKAIYGGGGSIGFIAHARSAMLVGSHPDDRDVRVLTQSKLNVGIKGPSLTYRLVEWEAHPQWGRVEWGDAVDLQADELMVTKAARGSTKQDEAEAWLLDTLMNGAMRSEKLEQRAEDEGYSSSTYRRARKVLKDAGLIDRRKVAGEDPHWEWYALDGGSE